jgi:D-aminoacyl-tRNA deacylase
MRIVLQVCRQASLSIDKIPVVSINKGIVAFVGFTKGDTFSSIQPQLDKLLNLRIFEDHLGKTNLDLVSIDGDILWIPNFTIYGDVSKSRRPSFDKALDKESAEALFEASFAYLKERYSKISKGVFGANMTIDVQNTGPFTLIV